MLGKLKKILLGEKSEEEKHREEEAKKQNAVGICAICEKPIYPNEEYRKKKFKGEVYIFHKKYVD